MKVTFVADKPASSGCAVIAVKKSLKTSGAASDYVAASAGQFKKAAKAAGFNGEKGKSFSSFAPEGSDVSRLVACGVGDGKDFDAEMFGAKVAKAFATALSSRATWSMSRQM